MSSYPDYPFTSKYFNCNGHRMHYIAEGDPNNPPLLFVHGNPTWSFYWRKLIAQFKDNFYCIAPDHIGMGLSDKPVEGIYSYQLADRIRDLSSFIEHLELTQKIHMMVHDWGGMIGCGFAVQNPERIASLAICNTAAFGLPPNASFPWQLKISKSVFGRFAIKVLNGFCRYAVKHCVTKTALPADVAAAYLSPYNNIENRTSIYCFVKDIPLNHKHVSWSSMKSVEENLDRLNDIPKIIFWGCKDFVFTTDFLDHWLEVFPGIKHHRFEASGHYIIEEEPEAICSQMATFLNQCQPA